MVSFKDKSKRYYEMVREGKIADSSFLPKKMVKKGYCGNEGFWFSWDRIKVH